MSKGSKHYKNFSRELQAVELQQSEYDEWACEGKPKGAI